jgi:ATP-dependent Lon protease
MTKDAHEKAIAELRRLEGMPPMSAESTVSRNYLDWLLDVPWKKKTKEIRDLRYARQVLEGDHYGLEKIKERILEFLSVRRLVQNPKGSILCFVGPPGVGKTSLGMSIAKATGRKFVRLSLGGVRDEAEIRGHRRTYIGALPGQLIQMMKKAGTKNPVVMLDEVDKMSMDFRGDPSAALLEVLDPEQNYMFMDHYLDVEYDLSQVFFIATANVLHTIPPALQDRMEVIRLSGYTEFEKLEIAKRFLVPKQLKDNGVNEEQVLFQEGGLQSLIASYTREAGVRNLEREIGNLCRKVARKVVEAQVPVNQEVLVPVAADGEVIEEETAAPLPEETAPLAKKGRKKAKREELPLVPIERVTINPPTVIEMLGPAKFRDTDIDKQNEIGATTGLAWTEVGGSILTTEATVMEGRGKLTTTGKLGDVMQESAQAAMSYVRSRAQYIGLPNDLYRHLDIHVHVPEGAIPKDGPSAGITIATSICSALTGIPVRCDIAMTGEITVRGRVLPIGGLKEKLLAAHRQGIHEIVLPKENERDLAEIPENVRKDMKLHFTFSMDEVLKVALEREIVALPLAPAATAAELAARPDDKDNLTH